MGVALDELAEPGKQRKGACHWMVDEVVLEAVDVQTDSMLLHRGALSAASLE